MVKGEGVLAGVCEDLGVRVQITESSNSFCVGILVVSSEWCDQLSLDIHELLKFFVCFDSLKYFTIGTCSLEVALKMQIQTSKLFRFTVHMCLWCFL